MKKYIVQNFENYCHSLQNYIQTAMIEAIIPTRKARKMEGLFEVHEAFAIF